MSSPSPAQDKRILDPIHGFIGFDPYDEDDRLAWALINQPSFQRLRHIKQLGFADYVFPGASHSRFIHSIGVFHMARRLSAIVAKKLGSAFDKKRAQAAKIAALLHDIGHGPFSHAFEEAEKKANHLQSHEEWTIDILKNNGAMTELLDKNHLLDDVIDVIKAPGKRDLYEAIVSSQFDADRLDYLQRDRYMSGIGAGGFDCDWLLECLEVSREQGFYLNHKSLSNAEEYVLARYHLHLLVYNHKAIRGAEIMLAQILSLIAQNPHQCGLDAHHPLLKYQSERNVENYLALNDMILWQALAQIGEQARYAPLAHLAQKLYQRQFYKCFDIGQDADSLPKGEEKLEAFLSTIKFDGQPFLYDCPKITAYQSQSINHQNIYIGQKDIIALSPIIKAIKPTSLCRIYALEPEDIEAIKQKWRKHSR